MWRRIRSHRLEQWAPLNCACVSLLILSFINKSSDASVWSNMTWSRGRRFARWRIMQPAGCKVAIWFIYCQGAPGWLNQLQHEEYWAEGFAILLGGSNHSWGTVVTWSNGGETEADFNMFVSKLGEYKGVFMCEHSHSSNTLCWRVAVYVINSSFITGWWWKGICGVTVGASSCFYTGKAPLTALYYLLLVGKAFSGQKALYSLSTGKAPEGTLLAFIRW